MPNDDYIKRSDAIEALVFYVRRYYKDTVLAGILQSILERVPAADVKPVRHGKWIWHGEGYDCSECKKWVDGDIRYSFEERTPFLPVYCPYCGAKMDKEEDDGTL